MLCLPWLRPASVVTDQAPIILRKLREVAVEAGGCPAMLGVVTRLLMGMHPEGSLDTALEVLGPMLGAADPEARAGVVLGAGWLGTLATMDLRKIGVGTSVVASVEAAQGLLAALGTFVREDGIAADLLYTLHGELGLYVCVSCLRSQ